MIEGRKVVHEARYPHSIERVWRALTDREELAAWLMPNDFTPVQGETFRFDARTASFGIFHGEVLAVEPPVRLQCRWMVADTPTIVTFTLRSDGEMTVLRVEHDGLGPDDSVSFDDGWRTKFDHDLVQVLDDRRDVTVATVDELGLTTHPVFEAKEE